MSDRRRIRLTILPAGVSVVAEMLDDEAPRTCRLVWNRLPMEEQLIHGRYSGMELFVVVDNPEAAPAENQTNLPLPGEILYWSSEDTSVTGDGQTVAEVCLIYGRGVTLRGPEGMPSRGSLFARIPGDWKYDWTAFREACRRVRSVPEKATLRIERVE